MVMRAFGDLSQLVRLQLVRDRFMARQASYTLRQHLDSVAPETPIRDIVDRCCGWESHAESMDHRGDSPTPRQPLPVYGEWPNWGDCGYYSGGPRNVINAPFAT